VSGDSEGRRRLAALRRYLVDAGLMTRAGGLYRRALPPPRPRTLVLMGVSGSGKTAVMAELARRLGWATAEGDDYHSAANVAKMAAGVPLTDEDRRPWLLELADWIGRREAAGENALLTCSALRRPYRDLLRDGHSSVLFAHLRASPEQLRARLAGRAGHYMPLSLLDSQLATLEPLAADEPGFTVDAGRPLDEVVQRVLDRLDDRPT
jgi:gluconokinase